MSCYYPTAVKNIGYTDEGKQILTTSWKGSQLDYDFLRPCGRCLGCTSQSRLDWSIRLYHESKLHEQAAMLTLTYSDENLPADGKLEYHDIQVFLKRLRRDMNTQLRYYVAGEYGEKTGRAHWHMVLYGADYLDGATRKNNSSSNTSYESNHIDQMWGKGGTDIIPLSPASCAYAAGYVNKKAGEEGIFRQSRKPPIAKTWVEANLDYLISRSRDDGLISIGYNRHPIPRKYLEWFPEELLEIAERQKEFSQPYKRINETINRNREINHKARVNIRNTAKAL